LNKGIWGEGGGGRIRKKGIGGNAWTRKKVAKDVREAKLGWDGKDVSGRRVDETQREQPPSQEDPVSYPGGKRRVTQTCDNHGRKADNMGGE